MHWLVGWCASSKFLHRSNGGGGGGTVGETSHSGVTVVVVVVVGQMGKPPIPVS